MLPDIMLVGVCFHPFVGLAIRLEVAVQRVFCVCIVDATKYFVEVEGDIRAFEQNVADGHDRKHQHQS